MKNFLGKLNGWQRIGVILSPASIVFPFRGRFRRLELEKRWGHRLCVVIFVIVQFCTAAFTAWFAYAVSAPQVQTMPVIETGVSNLPHLSSESDADAILTDADRAALRANIPTPSDGANVQGTMTLKQFGQRIKAKYPVYNDLDDEKIAQSVLAKYPQYRGLIKGADNPVQEVPNAWDAQGNPITFDWTESSPIVKIIQMPDGSTSRFARTVSDDAIKAQWQQAETHHTLKALLWAALFTVASALFVNYALQGAYLALLYVVFGR